MTPIDHGHASARMRRWMTPVPNDRHIQHTHQMLIASSVAAMVIVGLAAMLIGAVI